MGYSCGCPLIRAGFLSVYLIALGCSSPIVKPGAIDPAILKRKPLPGNLISQVKGGEYTVQRNSGWMGDIDHPKHLFFAGFRPGSKSLLFCLVIACDPVSDQLVLLPLKEGETPLTVIADPIRRNELHTRVINFKPVDESVSLDREYILLSLSQAIAEKKLGIPLPKPGRIFAVTANFPSHIKHDLAMKDPAAPEILGTTRARIFLKYPPVMPPDSREAESDTFTGIIGPYDGIDYPSHIILPHDDETPEERETRLDYEVEIGVVIGRQLTWDTIRNAREDVVRSAIAGYVLVSDTKTRNPQVVERIMSLKQPYPEEPGPYLTGNEGYDRAVGLWSNKSCAWWGYAASWGNYASLGPFFVSAPPDLSFPSRALLSARSYGEASKRPVSPPKDHADGALYLRQCSTATEKDGYQDKLIWDITKIIRSILEPGGALDFGEGAPRLEPGDIICLGTPGGTVITGKSRRLVSFLNKVLFWRDPMDWHDAFFNKSAGLYLHDGDEVLFWAEGLGFQHQEIRRIHTK